MIAILGAMVIEVQVKRLGTATRGFVLQGKEDYLRVMKQHALKARVPHFEPSISNANAHADCSPDVKVKGRLPYADYTLSKTEKKTRGDGVQGPKGLPRIPKVLRK